MKPDERERMTEATWAEGFGAIRHGNETRARIRALADRLPPTPAGDRVPLYEMLHAADRLTCAGLWLVAHDTYARNVYLDGRPLGSEDFKPQPEGHTGGSLNMVPAYVGYLVANALSGHTRGWLMGQGHCVSAIDGVNLLVGNQGPAHAARYALTDEGLTRYVRDFYSYRIAEDGQQDSPRGSHVNAHTAGSLAEGGYLGFSELEYVHMPLPGERLVVFLSDGAFEEQRGSDWAPRWWRASDSGLVAPIMIANGRRIDQRTTMSQQGGSEWFTRHLALNGFDPFVIDGRDPAAFAWAILEMESRLQAAGRAAEEGTAPYPVPLPYCVAVAPKGAGFYGEGTNLAHNLPLGTNPSSDPTAAERFNESARRLFVPRAELGNAIARFQKHEISHRPRERDHALATRNVPAPTIPVPDFHTGTANKAKSSPMAAVDAMFASIAKANPQLRPRIGNPDEMRSNRMVRTLELLGFRVTAPEPGIPERLDGAVITALNEEAVSAAALANQGGLNIVVTYEAFGTKMLGGFRQHITFNRQLARAGRTPRWLSVPLVLTSHTWENAKNEHSHQDPSMAEAMLGEPSDVSRVMFAADHNTGAAIMEAVYQTHGQVWTVVVPKNNVPERFTADEARTLVREGALALPSFGSDPKGASLQLVALGAYQLEQAIRASERLKAGGVTHTLVYMLEPGRFRAPRSPEEQAHAATPTTVASLFPPSVHHRIFFTHTRPEPVMGVLAPLNAGCETVSLGYIGEGGTLETPGMMFANRCTWAHGVAAAGGMMKRPIGELLSVEEIAALEFRRSPHGVL